MRPIIYEELKVGDKVVTRDGREGRVICTDAKGRQPIICLINDGDIEAVISYYIEGTCTVNPSPFDIFLPPKKEYVSLYRSRDGRYNTSPIEGEAMIDGFDVIYEFIKTIEVEL